MHVRSVLAGAALLLAGMGAAHAQYYVPPGYRPPPPGYRCDAHFRTPYGPRQLVCPLERPKPVGYRCVCVPPGPPGAGYGAPIRGRVIP